MTNVVKNAEQPNVNQPVSFDDENATDKVAKSIATSLNSNTKNPSVLLGSLSIAPVSSEHIPPPADSDLASLESAKNEAAINESVASTSIFEPESQNVAQEDLIPAPEDKDLEGLVSEEIKQNSVSGQDLSSKPTTLSKAQLIGLAALGIVATALGIVVLATIVLLMILLIPIGL